MTTVIGIDPGLKGGWAVLADDMPDELIECGRLPVVDNQVNPLLLHPLSDRWPFAIVAIEVQMAMPKQGRSSTLKTGRSWGQLIGYFQGRGHRIVEVRSQEWKPTFNLTRKPKEASRARAIELWPHFAHHSFPNKQDEGVAEACLIGYHQLKQETQ